MRPCATAWPRVPGRFPGLTSRGGGRRRLWASFTKAYRPQRHHRCELPHSGANPVALLFPPSHLSRSRGLGMTNDQTSSPLVLRYAQQPAYPALSYATVRDYCDSVEAFPWLSTRQNDLKDVE